MNKHVGCVCSIALVIFSCVSIPPTVTAQTGDASALPLLSADGLQYVGGFRLRDAQLLRRAGAQQLLAHRPREPDRAVGVQRRREHRRDRRLGLV